MTRDEILTAAKLNLRIRDANNDTVYFVASRCKLKTTKGGWVSGICYKSETTAKMYIREETDFCGFEFWQKSS